MKSGRTLLSDREDRMHHIVTIFYLSLCAVAVGIWRAFRRPDLDGDFFHYSPDRWEHEDSDGAVTSRERH